MAKSDDFVRVRVRARQRVSYDQILTFRRENWERFKKQEEEEAKDEITDRLDLRDVIDADAIEDGWEAEVIGKNDKPVKPRDAYET